VADKISKKYILKFKKYRKQNRSDEKAISFLTNYFLFQHGDIFDIQFHGSKDNTPDTDGFIRLREEDDPEKEKGHYLNKVVFFQLKGERDRLKNKEYSCKRDVFDFCSTINLPTILFIVDGLGNDKVKKNIYWYYFSSLNIELIKSLDNGEGRVKIPNLQELKVDNNDYFRTFFEYINDLSNKDLFQDLPAKIREISSSYRDDMIKIVTAMYLLQDISVSELAKVSKLLKINKNRFDSLISDFESKGIIFQNKRRVIFQDHKDQFDRYIGNNLSYEGYSKINIDEFLVIFGNCRFNILKNMASINLSSVKGKLIDEAEKMVVRIKSAKSSADIFKELEVFSKYSYAIPKETTNILRNIKEDNKPEIGEEVILKELDILKQKNIFFNNQSKVLNQLFSYIKENKINSKIFDKAKNIIIDNFKYDVHVVKYFEYSPQKSFLNYIEKWGKRKKKWYTDILIETLKELLSTECEGTEWQDENTISFQRGGLLVTEDLIDIRSRALSYLMDIYKENQDVSVRQDILNALNTSTQMPMSYVKPVSEYTELKELIIKNTEEIMNFYIEILEDSDLSLVRKIDSQTVRFERRFGKDLSNLEKLKEKIVNKDNYGIFKTFTNVEMLDEEGNLLDWHEQEEKYEEKVLEFIDELNEDTLESWIEKLREIIINLEDDTELISARYLNKFLEELGERKPAIARQILEELENDLNDYLIYLLLGMWNSKEHEEIRDTLIKWAKDGNHLRQIVLTLDKAKDLDYQILSEVFQKTKQGDEVDIHSLIVIAILQNFKTDLKQKEKYIELLILCTKSLTNEENTYWTRYFYDDQEIVDDWAKDDYKEIIENLVYASSLDYHVENILIPIISKYPRLILDLLKKRILRESERRRNGNRESYYNAIPLEFDHIAEDFKSQGDVLIPELLKWLEDDNINFQAAVLLKAIWELEELVEYITDGGEIVLSEKALHRIIDAYQGRIKLDGEFVKLFLKKYTEEDKLISLMSVMSVPGRVVTGEYGFAEDLEDRLKYANEVQENTKNIELKEFIEKYKKFLRKRAEYERKTTEEQIAIRRSRFNQ
jgi:hypothetical protein